MNNQTVIGIDLGGTHARAGIIANGKITDIVSTRITPTGTVEEVLQEIYRLTDQLMNGSIAAIGIGVPSVVDIERGIVYDVQNIPSWKEVALKKTMEARYQVPVMVNNDANCFALGEKYFGKGRQMRDMIGLTVGTGLGAGIIINDKLYAGANCGAGEFGMVDYLDKYYEYYASGQFFRNVYQIDGEVVFKRAGAGDPEALKMYREMGTHLGNAIKMILYTFDVELIVLGGSVRHAWPYFSETMWQRIKTCVYHRSVSRLRIVLSELEHSGISGAAALCYDAVK